MWQNGNNLVKGLPMRQKLQNSKGYAESPDFLHFFFQHNPHFFRHNQHFFLKKTTLFSTTTRFHVYFSCGIRLINNAIDMG